MSQYVYKIIMYVPIGQRKGSMVVNTDGFVVINFRFEYSIFTYFTNYKANMEEELIDKYEKWEEMMSDIVSNNNLDDFESKAPVGSSAKISFGSLINALAQAQRCFCPPETS